jgi:hypothetical protein
MLKCVSVGVDRRSVTFVGAVTASFVLGWLVGLTLVLKVWSAGRVPHATLFGGAGYAAFMLLPVLSGILVTRAAGFLYGRGWGGGPVRFLGLGLGALLVGILAL